MPTASPPFAAHRFKRRFAIGSAYRKPTDTGESTVDAFVCVELAVLEVGVFAALCFCAHGFAVSSASFGCGTIRSRPGAPADKDKRRLESHRFTMRFRSFKEIL